MARQKLKEQINIRIENLRREQKDISDLINKKNPEHIKDIEDSILRQEQLLRIRLRGLEPLQPKFKFELDPEHIEWMGKDLIKQFEKQKIQSYEEINRIKQQNELMSKKLQGIEQKLKNFQANIPDYSEKIEYAG